MATSLYKGQIPFRPKGQHTCLHHKESQLNLYCKSCHELACMRCLSSVHNCHPLCALSEITSQQKRDIQNFIEKTENVDLVQIDKFITDTDNHLKENTSHFEKLSQQLRSQTDKLKNDLDQITAQTLSLYQQMEEDNTKLLQTYKQDLEIYNTQLKQQVRDCRIALESGSDIEIYDGERDIQSFQLPVKPILRTASYTPNRHPQGHLEKALGEGTISSQGQGKALQGHEWSVGSSAGPFPTKQSSEPRGKTSSSEQRSKGGKGVSNPVYTLLSQTKVLEEWRSPSSITSVCPTTDGQVWTSTNDSKTLTLLNKNGRVLQEVKHITGIIDISLSPTTNKLWISDRYNNIAELVSGRLVHRFSTTGTPRCICITTGNHVIVGTDEHISKFTTKGKQILTTLAEGTGKPLARTPYRIAECPVSHNVAVAEINGEGKSRIVVMDKYFKELFVCDGRVPHIHQPSSQPGGNPFNPYGVVYDSAGNLVIADRDNNRILLISGHGEFLRIIQTDGHWTHAVGVDREDVLWAVFGICKVKLLQYSNV